MIDQAVILAGGMGTRLKTVISDIPKPMAPVAGRPFLEYLLDYLSAYGVNKVVLSVGYRSKVIVDHFGSSYTSKTNSENERSKILIEYAFEDSPLGTGGGILNALDKLSGPAFVLNGDSMMKVDLRSLSEVFLKHRPNASICLTLKQMNNFDRYGTVELNKEFITAFNEKKAMETGLINAGVYAMDSSIFDSHSPGDRFSFETDILEPAAKGSSSTKISYLISDGYFIDIGIPEDFEKAQTDFLKST